MASKVKAWLTAGRFFALPWMFLNTLLPIYLAGFSLSAWFLAFAITSSVLVAGHYVNNWRDYVRGVDKIEGGSVAKPYTGASQILPRGLLSIRTMVLSAFSFLAFALFLLTLCPMRPEVATLFFIGVALSLLYTDVLKPYGLGEVALFLGHGMSVTLFSYALIRPLDLTAVATGTLLGLWAAVIITMDQYPDAKIQGARGLVNLIFKADLKPSQYVWFAVSGIFAIQTGFTVMGILPPEMLLTVLELPFIHLTTVVLDADFGKGMLMLLTGMFFYPVLATLGLLML